MIFRRKILIILSLLFLQFSFNKIASVEPDEFLEDSKLELRARDISKNIRCMVCQNQSIDDSDSPLAKDLRILIRNEIKIGKSDKEIYKFLSDRYGDFILLKPPLKFNTLALWFLPFIFLGIGIFFIFFHNRKSNNL
ncbi:cytochrome c-type biogenesis protein CcmH [Pelagibacteraceae bacterium]|nr:cytochrome c-type biogenesis protein CcmH [Pelagibacteraceae bacterium]